MQSPDFSRRMERVLSARVEAVKAREARPRRIVQGVGIVVGTVVCFFVLKAMAVAQNGGPLVSAGSDLSEAGIGASIYHWVAGADPVSSLLAAAINPDLGPGLGNTPPQPTLIPETGAATAQP